MSIYSFKNLIEGHLRAKKPHNMALFAIISIKSNSPESNFENLNLMKI